MLKKSRIGITNYILGNALAVVGWSVLTVILCEYFVRKGLLSKESLTFAVSSAAALAGAWFYALSAGRLRDLNLSAWLTKVLALPIPGLIILPFLCFTPGSSGSNDHGDAPESPGVFRVLVTVVLALLSFSFFTGALTTYHATMRL